GLQSNHGAPSEFAYFRNIYIQDLDENPDYVLKGFDDEDGRVRRQAYHAAVRLGHATVPDLIEFLSSEEPVLQYGARQVLFDLIAEATDPAGKNRKNKLKKELRKNRKNAKTKMARQFLDNLIRMI